MKLKCRINGKDYDIVQGASFTDNFNETLDSASICLDQVYKINNLQPYDDVFIWNADEEFNGYGNVGDIVEFDYDISISGQLIGTGVWSDSVDLGEEGIKVVDNTSYFELSGPICQIWAYRFYDFTNSNENTCRYNVPSMAITITFGVGDDIVTATGFYLKNVDDKTHGTMMDQIILTNGIYNFSCTYVNETKSFLVNINQYNNATFCNLTQISVVSSSYKTQDINKIFTIDADIPIFSEETVNNFVISLLYRGLLYSFDLISIESSDSNKREVTFNNKTLGEITLTFDYNEQWTSIIENKTSTDIFSEVDNITITELVGVAQKSTYTKPSFYKHLLVDQFSEEMLGLETGLYKYQIDLFSETKRLEKIILPNISITQSLVQEEKRTCWFYLQKYLDTFSPKYKKVLNSQTQTWQYVNKYYMSESGTDRDGVIANLKEVFDQTICPEFSLTNPSLKDLIAQIMIVKDMIPIVKDDVIYGMDIGNLVGNFDRTDNAVNFTSSSMSSSNFSTDARREYSNALSHENSAHLVEYLGFRSPDSAFLTLDSLTLETRFPIYKINSIKMCYYKKATLEPIDKTQSSVTKIFLCKQDITPLVLLNTVRNSLSTNWKSYQKSTSTTDIHDFSDIDYSEVQKPNTGLEYAAQYKLCTIGYDIGSNKITGWGTKYDYLTGFLWFKGSCSYIENIVNLVDNINLLGSITELELKNGVEGYEEVVIYPGIENIITFDGSTGGTTNIAKQIKSIVFEVDYTAMYNGAVVHSKDNVDKDDLVTADNCSASLTVLESDGLFEREKMNRLGNRIFKLTARYDEDNGGAKPSRIQKVGTYDEVTDSIIYMREYSIFDKVILANYESTYEYVLKNYFTSVWAKYRTYSLMSYSESIRRTENVRKLLVLSKDKIYYENKDLIDDLNFSDINTTKYFLSFVTPTVISADLNKIKHDEKLNCGYFIFYNSNNDIRGYYLSDINTFASGTSLCFNIATYDNVSGGNYIDEMSADLKVVDSAGDALDYKTTQKWWSMVESGSDAFTESVGFYVGNLDNSSFFHDDLFEDDNTSNVTKYAPRYMALPGIISGSERDVFNSHLTNKIGVKSKKMCKDNKELLDVTMQFSFISHDNDNVLFSPWVCKLNDLVGYYNKFESNKNVLTDIIGGVTATSYIYDKNFQLRYIVLKIKKDDFEKIKNGDLITSGSVFSFQSNFYGGEFGIGVALQTRSEAKVMSEIVLKEVYDVTSDSLTLNFACTCFYQCTWESIIAFFVVVREEKWSGAYIQQSRVTLSKVKTETINEVEYYYLQGRLDANDLYVDFSGIDGKTRREEFSPLSGVLYCSKKGNSDVTQLNANNSLINNTIFSSENDIYVPVRKNMFIVVSSESIERKLEFNYYKYSIDKAPIINTFPNTMYVDDLNILDDNIKEMNDVVLPTIPSTLEDFSQTAQLQYPIIPKSCHLKSKTINASGKWFETDYGYDISDDNGITGYWESDEYNTYSINYYTGEITINYKAPSATILKSKIVPTLSYKYGSSANVSIDTIFNVFQDSNDTIGIQVNPEKYKNNSNIPFKVKSIQYYYRDNNTNVMYFVFGVNLPEISKNNISYDTFRIYLSAISKRCMDVYDENHNIVGTASNMLDNPNLPFSQRYDLVQSIPSEYVSLQFLESDGRQYLDLSSLTLTNYNSFECDFMTFDTQVNEGFIFGNANMEYSFAIKSGSTQGNSAFIQTQITIDTNINKSSDSVALNPNEKYHARVYYNNFSINNITSGYIEIPDLYTEATNVGLPIIPAGSSSVNITQQLNTPIAKESCHLENSSNSGITWYSLGYDIPNEEGKVGTWSGNSYYSLNYDTGVFSVSIPSSMIVRPNDLLARITYKYGSNYDFNSSGVYLFGCKNETGKFVGRMYNFKIYNINELTHNFVPCMRISDNKPGMYDTINKIFYTNSGLGEFKYRF